MAGDLGVRMEYHERRVVGDVPATVEQPPGEIELLVSVPQASPVPADFPVGAGADRARPTQERSDVAAPLGAVTAEPWYVSSRGLALLIDKAE